MLATHAQTGYRPAVRISAIRMSGASPHAPGTQRRRARHCHVRSSARQQARAVCATQAVKQAVDWLYSAGVRRFFIMGAPPLHDAPTMRVMAPSLAASDLGRLAAFGLQTGLDAQTQVRAPCLNASLQEQCCLLPTTDPSSRATPEPLMLARHMLRASSGQWCSCLLHTTPRRHTVLAKRGGRCQPGVLAWPHRTGAGCALGRDPAATRQRRAYLLPDTVWSVLANQARSLGMPRQGARLPACHGLVGKA